MTRLADHLLNLDDPPVKALVVYQANPMGSNPDQQRVREGLMREDLFTVVMEQFPTDTVDYADIVLPSTMQTEHLDVNDGYGHFYIHLNRPAVAASRRGALDARDVPADRPRDGARPSPRCTRATRRSRARCSATTASTSSGTSGWKRYLPEQFVAVHRRLPDALRQARVLLREGGAATAWTRSRATRRARPRRPTRTTRSR